MKQIARMVNADWHDGYEEYESAAAELLSMMQAPLEVILSSAAAVAAAPKPAAGLRLLTATLVTMGSAWDDLRTVPGRRGDWDEVIDEDQGFLLDLSDSFAAAAADGPPEAAAAAAAALKHTNRRAALGLAWGVLLRAAAAAPPGAVGDDELGRCLAAATDFEVDLEDEVMDSAPWAALPSSGKSRLQQMLDADDDASALSAWRRLPSQRKQHSAKRVVDRRYEGAKHKRTRDFGGGYY